MAYGPEAKYFSNLNFTVYQSKAGFLWIGTQNGLVRFDGKRYKNFFSDYTNPNSPSDNNIPDIVEDKNGDLWFCGFYHGLTKYNESTGIFKKYTNPTAHNKPSGKLAEAIKKTFPSFADCKIRFADTGKNRFGSRWACLYVDKDKT